MSRGWFRLATLSGLFVVSLSAHAATVSTTELDVARTAGDPPLSSVSFPIQARSDQSLSGAELRLTMGGGALSGVRGLEVRVGSERVALVSPSELNQAGTTRAISIAHPPDRSQLTLRLLADAGGTCAILPAGAWSVIRTAELVTESRPLPLPDDLALLPLPFVDRGHDADATVPFVFAAPPSEDLLRQAGLVAGWFGIEVGIPLRFSTSLGALPDESAVVLLDSAVAAKSLGIPEPDGPSAQMVDHPRFPGSNVKLLLLSGRTPEELETAVRGLAGRTVPLAGRRVHFDRRPYAAASQPDDAPRWIPNGFVPFERYPDNGKLQLTGTSPGSIDVKFRIAPDTWTWPAEYVRLELGYAVSTTTGASPPELDVEVNDRFVARLPTPPSRDTSWTTIPVRADLLRGFNALRVHVRYPGVDACSASAEEASVTLSPASGFHLDSADHFASLPDVSLFVHDGFPFTRIADLGETAVVLPDLPDPTEISTLLSVLAHFARVTGMPGTRLTVLSAQDALAHPGLDKDLLLVGLPGDNPLLRRWADHMPLVPGPAGAIVQMPAESTAVLRVLTGHLGRSELHRAAAVASETHSLSAVMGWESTLKAGRSVIALTATSLQDMPAMSDVSGFADARSRAGDLLIASGARRRMFRIGPSYDAGQLRVWSRARWSMASHWLVLFPGLFAGAFLLSGPVRRRLDQTIRQRLHGA
jgi:cellulose synthase (UDP-forming)